jgi:flagellar basal-body rod protein FlgB
MSLSSIEALTVPALSAALDAALIRQQVGAHNIANANTEGFQPQRVSFEVAMSTARSGSASGAVDLALSSRLEPQLGLSVDGAVRLDSEVAAMAQNSAHYQALLKALNRHLSVLATAVSDGKR